MSMNIYTEVGKLVKYDLPNNGWPEDKETAFDYLTVNKVYTIKEVIRGDDITHIKLKEVPGVLFNSVLFSNYKTNKKHNNEKETKN